MMSQEIQPES